MSKKKILTIIETLGVGGAEKLVIHILNNLQGYELHLIVLNEPNTLIRELKSECKYTFLNFRNYLDIPKCARAVRKYIRKYDINIVHTHMYWSNIISRFAVPKHVRVFNCIHNISSLASYKANRASLYLDRLTYRKRHHILAVSKTVLDDFDEWVGLRGPSTVIYNIIDDVFFTAAPKTNFSQEKIRMVAVGNLRKQKNYPYILEAFKHMPPGISLDIFGSGTLKEDMQREITSHNLNIKLQGLQENMHEVLRGYDGYVMCSTHEGLSLALMEAMASGLPAFISDIPVQRETAGNAAIFFDLNDPKDAAVKITNAYKDPARLGMMSATGIERAGEIAKKENYIRKLIGLYEEQDAR